MAAKFNIKLLHLNLTDTKARIISLLVYGLEYFEIEIYLGIGAQTIHNYISVFCGEFELSGVFHLLRVAREQGFDKHGNFDTIALFTPNDFNRLLKRFPVSRKKADRSPATLAVLQKK